MIGGSRQQNASHFRHDLRYIHAGTVGGSIMRSAELFRRRAEECLNKAKTVSGRQTVRLLLVQAHNHLKQAEEAEAEDLNART